MFTFGSDPEFMLVDRQGEIRSAIGIIAGTRDNPIEIDGMSFCYDNVLAECRIKPAKNRNEALRFTKKALKLCDSIARPHGVRLLAQAAADYSQEQLAPKDAKIAACENEWCAYAMTEIKPISTANKIRKGTLRTTGGHIHIGTDLAKDQIQSVMLVRMLDLFLGIPSLFIDHDPTSPRRKKLYGRAGRYRRPDHGIEYRSLSNFWLSSPSLVELVHSICKFTVKFVENEEYEEFWAIDRNKLASEKFINSSGDPTRCHVCHGYDVKRLRKAFDAGDLDMAKEFLNLAYIKFPDDICEKLVEEQIRTNPYDLYEEWNLKP
jgi:hypothetical protein